MAYPIVQSFGSVRMRIASAAKSGECPALLSLAGVASFLVLLHWLLGFSFRNGTERAKLCQACRYTLNLFRNSLR